MTLMKSGHHTLRLAVAGLEPVCRGQGVGVFGQYAGQAGEDIGEVLYGVDSQAAAVFYDGVVDGALFSGQLVADEEPILIRVRLRLRCRILWGIYEFACPLRHASGRDRR